MWRQGHWCAVRTMQEMSLHYNRKGFLLRIAENPLTGGEDKV